MRMLQRFWKDEAGFVVSTELVLIATILVIAMVVGLATVRNHVVQELGDVALAVGNLNQSLKWTGIQGRQGSSGASGSVFVDQTDFCDGATGEDTSGQAPAGISVQVNATPEGS